MIGIYRITSPSGSVYIGQTRNTKKRFPNYRSCSRKQIHIYNSLQKYGYSAHSFEVIHELPNDVKQDVLDKYEVLYWEQYKEAGFNMMNIRKPGKSGGHTEESRKKMSDAKKGIKHSKEHNMKIGLSQRGRVFSEETRKKMSLAKLKANGKQQII